LNYLLINSRTQSVGIPWDSDNEEHFKEVAAAIKMVLGDIGYEYELKKLKQGITVYLKMETKKRPIFGYKRLRYTGEELDEIHGYFFFHALKGMGQVKEFIGTHIQEELLSEYSKNLIFLKNSNLKDLPKLLSENHMLEKMLEIILKRDMQALLGRKRMETKMAEETISKRKKK
jgi:hypothetical protein